MPKITKKRLEILLEKLHIGLSICDQGRNGEHCVQCPIKDAMIEAEAITKVILMKRNEIATGHQHSRWLEKCEPLKEVQKPLAA